MKIAALYDIHGNAPALEAVLREVARWEVDQIVVGGDTVAGPLPRETMALLAQSAIPVQHIRGNTDREVRAIHQGHLNEALPEQALGMMRWTAAQLSPAEHTQLAGWPAAFRLHLDGLGSVLFCHATPLGDMPVFTRNTKESVLLPHFQDCAADLVVCGHTHMQFDRHVGSVRVINAGSVGMPFGATGAFWLLLHEQATLMHTSFDLEAAATRIRASSYPQAKEFAANNVLAAPAETDTLAWLDAMAIGA